MKALSRIAWHIAITFIVGVAGGLILLFIDQQLCGEINGQNAAGAGAAIGMFAAAAATATWLFFFLSLSLVDLGRHLKLWSLRLSARREIVILFSALVIWTIAAMTLLQTEGC